MKAIDVDRIYPPNRGIKVQGKDKWYNFDESNSEHSKDEMQKFMDRNQDRIEGNTIGIEESPDSPGDFVSIDIDYPEENTSSGSQGSGPSQKDESIQRQKAFAEVREWWTEYQDPRKMDRKEYQKFIAMVRDAFEFMQNGEFESSSHFLIQLIENDELDVPDEVEQELREEVDEGGPSEEETSENESDDEDDGQSSEEPEENESVDEEESSESESEEVNDDGEEDETLFDGSKDSDDEAEEIKQEMEKAVEEADN